MELIAWIGHALTQERGPMLTGSARAAFLLLLMSGRRQRTTWAHQASANKAVEIRAILVERFVSGRKVQDVIVEVGGLRSAA